MFIGLTGRIAGGKGVISEFFKEKGFEYLSLSQEVRLEAQKRGIFPERKNLQDLGNLMREEGGPGVLAKRIIKKINENKKNKDYKNYIIDGIRNTGEVEELRKAFGKSFFLISVDSELSLRWRNLQKRGKESDPKKFEEFIEADKRDFEENTENGQQVRKCMEMADYKILNNGTIQELNKKIEKIYDKIKNKK
jgi:dephospho-CoA kinase